MATPGIGDPYWFEWYVGLKNIINMLNPDNGIEYVIFQCSKYNTIDDVVVGYKDGGHEICYQISMLRLYCDVVLVMRASWLTPSFVVQRAS